MDVSLLDLLLDPLARSFSKSQAQQILCWKLTPEQERRFEFLREGANDGSLSADEDSEYKQWVDALDVIAIIQTKARRSPAGSEIAA